MTRLQQARFLAQTDEYWRAYLDGLADRHRVRDTTPDAWTTPSASITELTARHQQHPPRRETWDSDWGPAPDQETPQPARND